MQRIGLLDGSLSAMSAPRKLLYVLEAYLGKLLGGLAGFVLSVALLPLRAVGLLRARRLTDTYLDDPAVRGNLLGAQTDDDDGDAPPPRGPRAHPVTAAP